jgi:molybdenum cofactor cytidylyltransferase
MKAEDVALLVLAAGRSARFGSEDKLLADLHGRPLGLHTPQRLAQMNWASKVAVTSGDLISPLRKLGFDIVEPVVDGGLGDNISKVVCGLNGPRAVLVCLADMPFVTQAHVEGLLAAVSSNYSIAASEAQGEITPPVLFAEAYFEDLRALTGDAGARDVIVANKSAVLHVPASRLSLLDVDTLTILAEANSYSITE